MAVLRVRHCRALLYCRRAPPRCPACGGDLRGAGLAAAPVRLDSPFRHGHRQQRAFLVRPTRGTFLDGYDGHCDLHVGISSSQGVVYNYDQEGVHRDGRGWEQCISIPLVQPDMWELLQHWDSLLEEFSLEQAWLPHSEEVFPQVRGAAAQLFHLRLGVHQPRAAGPGRARPEQGGVHGALPAGPQPGRRPLPAAAAAAGSQRCLRRALG
ncbi:MKRN2 opposite strand protein isoform X2 [Agelaius tricolor]|uniref:MKRN2 opposite strand protein isoform X2 n=1 Tax=Agelaius tricolor TaxID=9191 RepID=UPI0039F1FB3E